MSVPAQGGAPASNLPQFLRTLAIGRHPKRTLIRLVILVVTSFVVFRYILIPVRVTGISMEPTYHNRSVNFIYRMAFLRHPPRRGDVVGIRFSTEALMYMKRIVGLPGETIAFSRGRVVVNGVRQEEPYVANYSNWEFPVGTLGPDEYYVVGDNRSMPPKFHEQGRVESARIVGRVVLPGNHN
jgi:signal peptidase I